MTLGEHQDKIIMIGEQKTVCWTPWKEAEWVIWEQAERSKSLSTR